MILACAEIVLAILATLVVNPFMPVILHAQSEHKLSLLGYLLSGNTLCGMFAVNEFGPVANCLSHVNFVENAANAFGANS